MLKAWIDCSLKACIECKTYRQLKSKWNPFSRGQLHTCCLTRTQIKILTTRFLWWRRGRHSSQRPWLAVWGSPTWTFRRICLIWRTRRRSFARKCASPRYRSPKASIKSARLRGKPTSFTGRNRRFWRTRKACQSRWSHQAVDRHRTTTRNSSEKLWHKSTSRAWLRLEWNAKGSNRL